MNPITKFEWKDNIEQEKDLLEYISILEELYIPDFDYDTDSPYYYGYERINKSEVSAEEWEEICNQPIYINVSETLRTFGDRYNKGLIAEHFNYANYMKHELIQQFIRGLDLDADKSFDFVIKTPPVAIQLLELAKIKSGSAEPNRKKVAEITWEQVRTIAQDKMVDLNCFTIESAMTMVAGTARSMGIAVKGEFPGNN